MGIDGNRPKPVLSPETAPLAETQPAETEEIAAVSVPKSRQPRTDTVSQVSRKKRQLEYIVEEREKDWQSWFWKWKWVVFGALAVLAMAIGMAVAMLTRPKIESGVVLSSPNLSARPAPMSSASASGTPTNPEYIYKSLPDTNAPVPKTVAPLSTSVQKAPTLSGAESKVGGGNLQTNPGTAVPLNPNSNESRLTPIAVTDSKRIADVDSKLKALRVSKAFILIVKSDPDGETTIPPLTSDLLSALIKWNSSHNPTYSLSASDKTDIATAAPRHGHPDQRNSFELFCNSSKDRYVIFDGKSLSIQNLSPHETFFIKLASQDGLLALIVSPPPPSNYKIELSKTLVEFDSTGISVTSKLKDDLKNWHVIAPDGNALSLSLQLRTFSKRPPFTPNSSDPFAVSWGSRINAAAASLKIDNDNLHKLQTKQENLETIENRLPQIHFDSQPLSTAPVPTIQEFLEKYDSKTPLLIAYATAVVDSINGTASKEFPHIDSSPSTDKVDPLKEWLIKTVVQNVQSQMKIAPSDDQDRKWNQSIKDFCKVWSDQFKSDLVNDHQIWSLKTNPFKESNEQLNQISTLKQKISNESNDVSPVNIADIQSTDLVVQSDGANSPTSIFTFDGDTYYDKSLHPSGAAK